MIGLKLQNWSCPICHINRFLSEFLSQPKVRLSPNCSMGHPSKNFYMEILHTEILIWDAPIYNV